MTMQKNKNISFPVSPQQIDFLKSRKKLASQTKFFRNGEKIGEKSSSVDKKQPPSVFFNACFDKNHLKTLIAWFLETYGEKQTVDLVENLKQVGFHQATRAGVSLGLDDLQIPPQKAALLSQASRKMGTVTTVKLTGTLTTVEKSQQLIDTWNQTSETLREKAIHHFRITNPVNPVYMMAFSGARGNISQVRQLVAMRGLMADPQGAIVEFPIQSNFREGLTVTEYLISCYGARKGLVDTALRTATSGYLTRRLVDAVQHVVIRVPDCQTAQGILLKEKNMEQRLIGRVLLQNLELSESFTVEKNTLISPRLAKKIASKYSKVFVRSPLTCQTEKSVCQLCYGLDLGEGKLVNIGEAVGIIAAQSIGEPGTQLTMRTFHTGGVGVFSEQSVKSFTAPFRGKVEFPEPLPGVFVRTPHGKIAYLVKHESSDSKRPLLRLVGIETSTSSSYEIQQSDVPVGSLLWVKQGEKVETGALLIQALNLETKKQEMPESSHPVVSPFSGEVFFEFMRIRETEVKKRKDKKKKPSSKKLDNEKEVVPIIPTLINLGNFWIMSSFIQNENYPLFQSQKISFFGINFLNLRRNQQQTNSFLSFFQKEKTTRSLSFFKKGDLVSRQTPIHQLNIHLSSKVQLKIVKSSLVSGSSVTKFVFSKIQYSQGSYFFKPLLKPRDVVVSTPKAGQILLTWYPFLSQRQDRIVGYIYPISDSLFHSQKMKFFGVNATSLANAYIWCPCTVSQFVETSQKQFLFNDSKKRHSLFIVAHGLFSKFGVFQIEKHSKVERNKQANKSLTVKSARYLHFYRSNCSILKKFQNNPLKTNKNIPSHSFKTRSQNVRHLLLGSFQTQIIEKENIWFYVSEMMNSKPMKLPSYNILLEPGKLVEKVCFTNSHISVSKIENSKVLVFKKKSSDFVNPKFFKFGTGKTKQKIEKFNNYYRINDLLKLNQKFENSFTFQTFSQKPLFQSFTRNLKTEFCFCRKWSSKEWGFWLQQKQLKTFIFAFQKSNFQILPEKKVLKQKWLEVTNPIKPVSIKSPLFTKQQKTRDIDVCAKTNIFGTIQFNPNLVKGSKWCLPSQILNVEITIQSLAPSTKTEQIHQIINFKSDQTGCQKYFQTVIPEWNGFVYTKQIFQDLHEFSFQTFENGWVLPEFPITQAFLKAQTLGEFQGFQKKEKQTNISLSLSRDIDFLTFKIPVVKSQKLKSPVLFGKTHISSTPCPKNEIFGINNVNPKLTQFGTETNSQNLGRPTMLDRKLEKQMNRVGLHRRWGQEWDSTSAFPASGQITKITQTNLTIRKGVPLLASLRGLVHVLNNDFVEKNQLLVTLRSKRLQTEDIVQGIPKIEQLFEARETQGGEIIQNNMHMLLHNFFRRVSRVRGNREAVHLSIRYIQSFLVDNILQAYSNQGVSIAEKHVEVVVRQMTARVRIVEGGDTGFLPGELIQHRLLEKLNKVLEQQNCRPAQYEPMILGITKSVLQSESFLLAASFQQVSKVLVQSALAKKTDFLRGLHENLIVGQLIPAGTGVINVRRKKKRTRAIGDAGLENNVAKLD